MRERTSANQLERCFRTLSLTNEVKGFKRATHVGDFLCQAVKRSLYMYFNNAYFWSETRKCPCIEKGRLMRVRRIWTKGLVPPCMSRQNCVFVPPTPHKSIKSQRSSISPRRAPHTHTKSIHLKSLPSEHLTRPQRHNVSFRPPLMNTS